MATPRISVSRDGAHAVVVEGARATVVRLADRATLAELDLPLGDVAWFGAASRLLVVAANEGHTEVRLIDPFGADPARRIAEIQLDSPLRLGASSGTNALLLGPRGAAVLTGGETSVTPYQFLARTLPQVVGVAGALFVVALPGTIEEWDPASRMPKRRLRLPKVAPITSLGGSERVLWMTTAQEPQRLDVLPLVNRGQPKAHELPEPIAAVSGHPGTDAVVCLGADTGRIYAIDLDGRTRLRTITVPGIDRAEAAALVVRGTALSVIAAQAGRPVATAAIEGAREAEPPTPLLPPIKRAIEPVRARSTLYDDEDHEAARPRTVAEALRRPPAAEAVPVAASDPPSARTITEALRHQTGEPSPARSIAETLRRRTAAPEVPEVPATSFAGRGDEAPAPRTITEALRRQSEPPPVRTEHPLPGEDLEQSLTVDNELVLPRQPTTTAWSEGASELMAKLAALRAPREGGPDARGARAAWRDDAGTWARAVASGTFDRAAPSCPPIDVLATRFDLPAALIPALVLLYGSHLAGMAGAAPMDIAKVLGRRWDEALGRGTLAELGLASYADSRVRLAPALLRVLDELPPHGELVGEPGSVALLGPTVLVSREPIRVLGVRIAEQLGGAVLLGSHVDAEGLALEARALGAVAVGQLDAAQPPRHPIVIVVGDEAAAEQIDLPRFELAPAGERPAT